MTSKNLYNKEEFLAFKSLFESNVHSGQLSQALIQIESLLSQYPDHPGMFYLAGLLYVHDQDYGKAKRYFEKALTLDANNCEYMTYFGIACVETEDLAKAETLLKDAYQLDPNSITILIGISKLYLKKGDFVQSKSYLLNAVEREPTSFDAHFLLGQTYLEENQDIETALIHFEKALKLGKNDELEYNYASALAKAGKKDQAVKYCKKFLIKNPNSSYAYKFRELMMNITRIHTKQQKTQETSSKNETNMNTKTDINSNYETNKKQVNNEVDKYQKVLKDAKQRLNQYILGQEDFVEQLCNGYMRSFVYKRPDISLKNTIFVSGQKGTGIAKSIRFLTAIMYEYNLYKNADIHYIDISSSKGASDVESTFLSDIYKGLSSKAEVIIIDNVDKCSPEIVSKLSEIIIHGKLKLKDRYVFNANWQMLEKTYSSLAQNAIDTLEMDDKLIILSSDKDFRDVRTIFPSTALEKIKDIAQTSVISPEILEKIAEKYIKKYQKRISDKLQLNIRISTDVTSFIVGKANPMIGVHGIKGYIEEDIYQSITELRMLGKLQPGITYKLVAAEDDLILDDEIKKITVTKKKANEQNLDAVKEELGKVIGLKPVKERIFQLEEFLALQKIRQSRGAKVTRLSMNFIFTGNPGTGKTTIARLVSKYLKALGYLSSGHLVEVDRGKLVAEYVGQTAPKTQAVIESAKGGVLFIDEAYSLARGGDSDFGKEAIDALVKGMEDFRDDMVVVLAGYKEEMEGFLKTNPGLRSRFNNLIDFPDYSSEELLEIAEVIAKSEGYTIEEDSKEGLIEEFTRKQIPGKNDSGNGRLARNVVEQAIAAQSARILKTMDPTNPIGDEELNLLTMADLGLDKVNDFDLEAELDKIVGLGEVKQFMKTMERQLVAQKKRKAVGINSSIKQSLNMIFTGNPGTGKTTVARLLGNMMKEMGALKSGHFVEVDRGDLVGEYVGKTAPKTKDKFMSALGGILFIDEAYALAADSYGQEAIDTIVKLMEDHRENIVVILAGYEKEMKEFLKTNTGLKSRFPITVDFKDYKASELVEIGAKMVAGTGYLLPQEAKEALAVRIESETQLSSAESGNGRMVRNIIEEAIRRQSDRIATEESAEHDFLVTFAPSDFIIDKRKKGFELEKELKRIIGLQEVKDFVRQLEKQIIAQQLRYSAGYKEKTTQNLNMIFTGNPGTGKTTVARVVGDLLKDMGVLKTGKMVEVDRGDLVASYAGQTPEKVKEVFMSALGGILFIDEAYALSTDSFGKEAIDTLVKLTEDHKGNVIVILAGYEKEMKEFLKTNSGLKSRFPININFADYSASELVEIGEKMVSDLNYTLPLEAKEALVKRIENEVQLSSAESGNGRMVRNIFEEAIRRQSERISTGSYEESEMLVTFEPSDFLVENRDKKFKLEKELGKIIGLHEVKEFVRSLEKQLLAQKLRQSAGIKTVTTQSLNMIFTGNPGTGKTTVARVVGELLKKMGVLKTGKMVEVDRGDLVASYAGQTPEKVKEVFMSALGGILFIDESYALSTDSMGKEAIDTLVRLIEDHRDSVIVILAGYEKDMRDFLKTNSGLKSRFPININFPDYTISELLAIAKLMTTKEGYTLTEPSLDALSQLLQREIKRSKADAGNGRLVRNVLEEALRKQSGRIVTEGILEKDEIVKLLPEDFINEQNGKEDFNLDENLQSIIGLNEVKDFIRSLQAQISIQQKRKSLGLPVDEGAALHMIFTGNPGTGKTTVSRIVADLLYNLGILPSNKLIEVDRSGLVAGYVGQTSIKTQEKIQEALGGVLFIDEAYSLAQDAGSSNGYGQEAIDTLLKAMEDYREDLIVILAGYTNEMEEFLDTNPGLRSRIPHIIEFKDYTVYELMQIGELLFKGKGYTVTEAAKSKIKNKIDLALQEDHFGNGRFMRNVYEETIRRQAVRLQNKLELTVEDLSTIEEEDINL
ncbi:AAA family ATPase [Bacillus sp. PS06]|uniref:AAA family ATPase n=1 Tax=Bacillus sp. PS06 TaxID=2764176 RepID=UPI001786B57B|nr:AAA family ATPase [Bacillus sp. PS06]MBD8070714.1 AAA family ATPase [Bacillus sp. PS06]